MSPFTGIQQTASSIGGLIKQEAPKVDNVKTAKKINNRDREGHDFINWSKGVPEDESLPAGKKKLGNHPGAQTSGNFIQWE